MEAVPRLPMLSFDLKHSPEYVEFGPTLKQYIQEHYGEDPAHYNKACTEIEQLRQTAIHVSRDFIGCTTLKKYYAQLQFLQGRFQLSEGGDSAIAFTWEDIQTGREHIIADIKFEQACILYNIGSLHSILGAVDTRQNAEGMKVSCTHFQCAAWAFEYLRDHFGSSAMSTDMAHEMLTFQVNLMLAQGQECILEKSMIDSRKNTITAKVAAQVVEFYKLAIKNLDLCNTEGLVNSRSYKDWKKRMELKVSFYQCITYYYTGKESEEKTKWGETLAYFKAALDKLTESIKMAKNEVPEIQDALKFAQDVVEGKYNSAKKDNDFVYHDKVPPLETLSEIKGASLVKGIPFNPNDPEISGPDIFQKLVPMEAHEASSVYSEEKAKLLRLVSGEVEEKNTELNQFVSSLQIDMDQLNPPVDRLPEALLEKCAALSVRTHAIQDLIKQMTAVSSVSTEVDMNIKEIFELLEEEGKKEEEFQKTFGNRTNSLILTDIRNETQSCQTKHKQGMLSNENLHAAMNMHIANLRLLAGPPEMILSSLPSSQPEKSADDEAVIEELRKLLGKIEEMKSQRATLHDQLRDQIQSDDITNVLVTQDGGNKETIFSEQLKKHDKLKTLLEQNMMAQNNILQALIDCNAKYATIRQTTAESAARRETRIKELINSYNVYEDLMAKSEKGLEYYKKLEETVGRLLQRCRGVCKVQQEERDQISNRFVQKVPPPSRPSAPKPAISNPSSPQPSLPSFDGPKLKDYLPFMKPASFGPKSKRGSATPSPSPSVEGVDINPQHLQDGQQEMPISVPAMYPQGAYPQFSQGNAPKASGMVVSGAHGQDSTRHYQSLPPDVTNQAYDQYKRSDSPQQPASLPPVPMSSVNYDYSAHMVSQYSSHQQISQNPGMAQLAYRQDSTSTVSSVETPVISPTNESVPLNPKLQHGYPQPAVPRPGIPQKMQSTIQQGNQQYVNQQRINPSPQNPVLAQQAYIPQQQAMNSGHGVQPHSQTYNSQMNNQQYNYQQPVVTGYQSSQIPSEQNTMAPSINQHCAQTQFIQPNNQHSMYQSSQKPVNPISQIQGQPGSQYWQRPSPAPSPNQQGEVQQGQTPYPQRPALGTSQQFHQHQKPPQDFKYNQSSAQVPNPSMMRQEPSGAAYGGRGSLPSAYPPGNSYSAPYQSNPQLQNQSNPNQASIQGYYPNNQSQQNIMGGPSMKGNIGSQVQNPSNIAPQQYPYQQQNYSPQHRDELNKNYQMSSQQQMNQPGLQNMQQGQPSQGHYPGQLQQYSQGINTQGQYPLQNSYGGQMNQGGAKQEKATPSVPNVSGVNMPMATAQNPSINMVQNQGQMKQPPQAYYQQPNIHMQVNPGIQPRNVAPQAPQVSAQYPSASQQSHFSSQSTAGTPTHGQYPNQQQMRPAFNQPSYNASNTMQYNLRGQIPSQPSGQMSYKTQQYQPYATPQAVYQNQTNPYQAGGSQMIAGSGQPPQGGNQFAPPVTQSGASQIRQDSNVPASYVPGNPRMPAQAPVGLKLPANLQQPLQPVAPASSQAPIPALPARQISSDIRQVDQPKVPGLPTESISSHPATPVNVPSTTNTPNLARQSSSLDEILSSSPDSVKQAAIPDPVIAPKVLTAQEKQQQKEEAMKNRGIPESKDPYSNPPALNKLVLDVERFGKTVDDLSANVASAHSKVEIIWRELMEYQEQEGKKNSIAIARCYPMKNRDQDIMPYDATRVLLSTLKDDYINANWINDLAPSCPKFIATQAPLPATTTDFWVMVYEQGTEVVVMITSEYETGKKYPIYWPTEKGKAMEHGPVILNLQSVKYKGLWTERIIYMLHTETKQGRTIVHLLYKNWPVSGFPDDVSHIVKFINEAHSFYKQQRSLMKPIIVHCGNGIGRCGTFLLIYTGMQEILHGNGMIDVQALVKRMLSKRKNSIQNPEQLRFAYEALLYFAEDFLKRRNILVHNPHYSKQKPKPPAAHTSADDIVLGSVNLQTIQQNVGRLGEKHETQPLQAQTLIQGQTTVTDSGHKSDTLSSLPDLIQQQTLADNGLGAVASSQALSDCIAQDGCTPSPQNRSRSGSTSSVLSSGSIGSATSKSSPQHKAEVKASPLADLQNPNTFTLDSNDKGKKRITKASFSATKKTSIKDNLDASDPLSNLDPLWNIEKEKK